MVSQAAAETSNAPWRRQRAGGHTRRDGGLWALARALVLAWPGSVLLLSTAQAQSAAEPWVSLFNGRDLTGWKIVALTNPASAGVDDGAMVLRQRSNTPEHTFVTSEREYGDFILELDLKDDPGFNSGILLRASPSAADAKVRLNGYQVKIDDTPRAWTGGVFDDFGDSWKWLHDLADNEAGRAAFKLSEWAHFRIECIGPTIKVWVNGVPTCHLVDEKYRKGSIAFKIHSVGNNPNAGQNAIRLKNIRILTDEPERYARPMALPPRRAPAQPGKYDKAKPQSAGTARLRPKERARLSILADMSNVPDEEQQMIQMPGCCTEFEPEAFIAVIGTYLRLELKNECRRYLHPGVFHRPLDGDMKAVRDLELRAAIWAEADHLCSIGYSGQNDCRTADVGKGESSNGSGAIAQALPGRPCPARLVVNAGGNAVTHALWETQRRINMLTKSQLRVEAATLRP